MDGSICDCLFRLYDLDRDGPITEEIIGACFHELDQHMLQKAKLITLAQFRLIDYVMARAEEIVSTAAQLNRYKQFGEGLEHSPSDCNKTLAAIAAVKQIIAISTANSSTVGQQTALAPQPAPQPAPPPPLTASAAAAAAPAMTARPSGARRKLNRIISHRRRGDTMQMRCSWGPAQFEAVENVCTILKEYPEQLDEYIEHLRANRPRMYRGFVESVPEILDKLEAAAAANNAQAQCLK